MMIIITGNLDILRTEITSLFTMATFIKSPSIIQAAGTVNKIIQEYFGHVNSNTSEVSIAHMKSPGGWMEPGQRPEFNEYTVVLKGRLKVAVKDGEFLVNEGQAIMTKRDEWVQYSTPFEGGAEYIAVCIPAFSPDTVQRDNDLL
jgi:mannose-6-phosphate isomerase-like protein (cupin superfamily)